MYISEKYIYEKIDSDMLKDTLKSEAKKYMNAKSEKSILYGKIGLGVGGVYGAYKLGVHIDKKHREKKRNEMLNKKYKDRENESDKSK
jgi:hypothetical protein